MFSSHWYRSIFTLSKKIFFIIFYYLGMITILQRIHHLAVPHVDNETPERIVFGGDVLTNERAFSAQEAMQNVPSEFESLSGLIHRPEGLHREMNFLLVYWAWMFQKLTVQKVWSLFFTLFTCKFFFCFHLCLCFTNWLLLLCVDRSFIIENTGASTGVELMSSMSMVSRKAPTMYPSVTSSMNWWCGLKF